MSPKRTSPPQKRSSPKLSTDDSDNEVATTSVTDDSTLSVAIYRLNSGEVKEPVLSPRSLVRQLPAPSAEPQAGRSLFGQAGDHSTSSQDNAGITTGNSHMENVIEDDVTKPKSLFEQLEDAPPVRAHEKTANDGSRPPSGAPSQTQRGSTVAGGARKSTTKLQTAIEKLNRIAEKADPRWLAKWQRFSQQYEVAPPANNASTSSTVSAKGRNASTSQASTTMQDTFPVKFRPRGQPEQLPLPIRAQRLGPALPLSKGGSHAGPEVVTQLTPSVLHAAITTNQAPPANLALVRRGGGYGDLNEAQLFSGAGSKHMAQALVSLQCAAQQQSHTSGARGSEKGDLALPNFLAQDPSKILPLRDQAVYVLASARSTGSSPTSQAYASQAVLKVAREQSLRDAGRFTPTLPSVSRSESNESVGNEKGGSGLEDKRLSGQTVDFSSGEPNAIPPQRRQPMAQRPSEALISNVYTPTPGVQLALAPHPPSANFLQHRSANANATLSRSLTHMAQSQATINSHPESHPPNSQEPQTKVLTMRPETSSAYHESTAPGYDSAARSTQKPLGRPRTTSALDRTTNSLRLAEIIKRQRESTLPVDYFAPPASARSPCLTRFGSMEATTSLDTSMPVPTLDDLQKQTLRRLQSQVRAQHSTSGGSASGSDQDGPIPSRSQSMSLSSHLNKLDELRRAIKLTTPRDVLRHLMRNGSATAGREEPPKDPYVTPPASPSSNTSPATHTSEIPESPQTWGTTNFERGVTDARFPPHMTAELLLWLMQRDRSAIKVDPRSAAHLHGGDFTSLEALHSKTGDEGDADAGSPRRKRSKVLVTEEDLQQMLAAGNSVQSTCALIQLLEVHCEHFDSCAALIDALLTIRQRVLRVSRWLMVRLAGQATNSNLSRTAAKEDFNRDDNSGSLQELLAWTLLDPTNATPTLGEVYAMILRIGIPLDRLINRVIDMVETKARFVSLRAFEDALVPYDRTCFKEERKYWIVLARSKRRMRADLSSHARGSAALRSMRSDSPTRSSEYNPVDNVALLAQCLTRRERLAVYRWLEYAGRGLLITDASADSSDPNSQQPTGRVQFTSLSGVDTIIRAAIADYTSPELNEEYGTVDFHYLASTAIDPSIYVDSNSTDQPNQQQQQQPSPSKRPPSLSSPPVVRSTTSRAPTPREPTCESLTVETSPGLDLLTASASGAATPDGTLPTSPNPVEISPPARPASPTNSEDSSSLSLSRATSPLPPVERSLSPETSSSLGINLTSESPTNCNWFTDAAQLRREIALHCYPSDSDASRDKEFVTMDDDQDEDTFSVGEPVHQFDRDFEDFDADEPDAPSPVATRVIRILEVLREEGVQCTLEQLPMCVSAAKDLLRRQHILVARHLMNPYTCKLWVSGKSSRNTQPSGAANRRIYSTVPKDVTFQNIEAALRDIGAGLHAPFALSLLIAEGRKFASLASLTKAAREKWKTVREECESLALRAKKQLYAKYLERNGRRDQESADREHLNELDLELGNAQFTLFPEYLPLNHLHTIALLSRLRLVNGTPNPPAFSAEMVKQPPFAPPKNSVLYELGLLPETNAKPPTLSTSLPFGSSLSQATAELPSLEATLPEFGVPPEGGQSKSASASTGTKSLRDLVTHNPGVLKDHILGSRHPKHTFYQSLCLLTNPITTISMSETVLNTIASAAATSIHPTNVSRSSGMSSNENIRADQSHKSLESQQRDAAHATSEDASSDSSLQAEIRAGSAFLEKARKLGVMLPDEPVDPVFVLDLIHNTGERGPDSQGTRRLSEQNLEINVKIVSTSTYPSSFSFESARPQQEGVENDDTLPFNDGSRTKVVSPSETLGGVWRDGVLDVSVLHIDAILWAAHHDIDFLAIALGYIESAQLDIDSISVLVGAIVHSEFLWKEKLKIALPGPPPTYNEPISVAKDVGLESEPTLITVDGKPITAPSESPAGASQGSPVDTLGLGNDPEETSRVSNRLGGIVSPHFEVRRTSLSEVQSSLEAMKAGASECRRLQSLEPTPEVSSGQSTVITDESSETSNDESGKQSVKPSISEFWNVCDGQFVFDGEKYAKLLERFVNRQDPADQGTSDLHVSNGELSATETARAWLISSDAPYLTQKAKIALGEQPACAALPDLIFLLRLLLFVHDMRLVPSARKQGKEFSLLMENISRSAAETAENVATCLCDEVHRSMMSRNGSVAGETSQQEELQNSNSASVDEVTHAEDDDPDLLSENHPLDHRVEYPLSSMSSAIGSPMTVATLSPLAVRYLFGLLTEVLSYKLFDSVESSSVGQSTDPAFPLPVPYLPIYSLADPSWVNILDQNEGSEADEDHCPDLSQAGLSSMLGLFATGFRVPESVRSSIWSRAETPEYASPRSSATFEQSWQPNGAQLLDETFLRAVPLPIVHPRHCLPSPAKSSSRLDGDMQWGLPVYGSLSELILSVVIRLQLMSAAGDTLTATVMSLLREAPPSLYENLVAAVKLGKYEVSPKTLACTILEAAYGRLELLPFVTSHLRMHPSVIPPLSIILGTSGQTDLANLEMSYQSNPVCAYLFTTVRSLSAQLLSQADQLLTYLTSPHSLLGPFATPRAQSNTMGGSVYTDSYISAVSNQALNAANDDGLRGLDRGASVDTPYRTGSQPRMHLKTTTDDGAVLSTPVSSSESWARRSNASMSAKHLAQHQAAMQLRRARLRARKLKRLAGLRELQQFRLAQQEKERAFLARALSRMGIEPPPSIKPQVSPKRRSSVASPLSPSVSLEPVRFKSMPIPEAFVFEGFALLGPESLPNRATVLLESFSPTARTGLRRTASVASMDADALVHYSRRSGHQKENALVQLGGVVTNHVSELNSALGMDKSFTIDAIIRTQIRHSTDKLRENASTQIGMSLEPRRPLQRIDPFDSSPRKTQSSQILSSTSFFMTGSATAALKATLNGPLDDRMSMMEANPTISPGNPGTITPGMSIRGLLPDEMSVSAGTTVQSSGLVGFGTTVSHNTSTITWDACLEIILSTGAGLDTMQLVYELEQIAIVRENLRRYQERRAWLLQLRERRAQRREKELQEKRMKEGFGDDSDSDRMGRDWLHGRKQIGARVDSVGTGSAEQQPKLASVGVFSTDSYVVERRKQRLATMREKSSIAATSAPAGLSMPQISDEQGAADFVFGFEASNREELGRLSTSTVFLTSHPDSQLSRSSMLATLQAREASMAETLGHKISQNGLVRDRAPTPSDRSGTNLRSAFKRAHRMRRHQSRRVPRDHRLRNTSDVESSDLDTDSDLPMRPFRSNSSSRLKRDDSGKFSESESELRSETDGEDNVPTQRITLSRLNSDESDSDSVSDWLSYPESDDELAQATNTGESHDAADMTLDSGLDEVTLEQLYGHGVSMLRLPWGAVLQQDLQPPYLGPAQLAAALASLVQQRTLNRELLRNASIAGLKASVPTLEILLSHSSSPSTSLSDEAPHLWGSARLSTTTPTASSIVDLMIGAINLTGSMPKVDLFPAVSAALEACKQMTIPPTSGDDGNQAYLPSHPHHHAASQPHTQNTVNDSVFASAHGVSSAHTLLCKVLGMRLPNDNQVQTSPALTPALSHTAPYSPLHASLRLFYRAAGRVLGIVDNDELSHLGNLARSISSQAIAAKFARAVAANGPSQLDSKNGPGELSPSAGESATRQQDLDKYEFAPTRPDFSREITKTLLTSGRAPLRSAVELVEEAVHSRSSFATMLDSLRKYLNSQAQQIESEAMRPRAPDAAVRASLYELLDGVSNGLVQPSLHDLLVVYEFLLRHSALLFAPAIGDLSQADDETAKGVAHFEWMQHVGLVEMPCTVLTNIEPVEASILADREFAQASQQKPSQQHNMYGQNHHGVRGSGAYSFSHAHTHHPGLPHAQFIASSCFNSSASLVAILKSLAGSEDLSLSSCARCLDHILGLPMAEPSSSTRSMKLPPVPRLMLLLRLLLAAGGGIVRTLRILAGLAIRASEEKSQLVLDSLNELIASARANGESITGLESQVRGLSQGLPRQAKTLQELIHIVHLLSQAESGYYHRFVVAHDVKFHAVAAWSNSSIATAYAQHPATSHAISEIWTHYSTLTRPQPTMAVNPDGSALGDAIGKLMLGVAAPPFWPLAARQADILSRKEKRVTRALAIAISKLTAKTSLQTAALDSAVQQALSVYKSIPTLPRPGNWSPARYLAHSPYSINLACALQQTLNTSGYYSAAFSIMTSLPEAFGVAKLSNLVPSPHSSFTSIWHRNKASPLTSLVTALPLMYLCQPKGEATNPTCLPSSSTSSKSVDVALGCVPGDTVASTASSDLSCFAARSALAFSGYAGPLASGMRYHAATAAVSMNDPFYAHSSLIVALAAAPQSPDSKLEHSTPRLNQAEAKSIPFEFRPGAAVNPGLGSILQCGARLSIGAITRILLRFESASLRRSLEYCEMNYGHGRVPAPAGLPWTRPIHHRVASLGRPLITFSQMLEALRRSGVASKENFVAPPVSEVVSSFETLIDKSRKSAPNLRNWIRNDPVSAVALEAWPFSFSHSTDVNFSQPPITIQPNMQFLPSISHNCLFVGESASGGPLQAKVDPRRSQVDFSEDQSTQLPDARAYSFSFEALHRSTSAQLFSLARSTREAEVTNEVTKAHSNNHLPRPQEVSRFIAGQTAELDA